MRQAGALAAVWQPVRGDAGVSGVIGVGWRRAAADPADRLKASLELLADRGGRGDRARGDARAADGPRADRPAHRSLQPQGVAGRALARAGPRASAAEQRLSIGLIDLDELKAFNDRWGHQAGDRLLLTAAARWRRRLRLTDLLARIGGDEFAVTLPGCELGRGRRASATSSAGALPDGLTCSIGVAEWVVGEPAESLLGRADRALYAAKDAGRNRTMAAPAVSAAGS